jgi:IS5 family transposase
VSFRIGVRCDPIGAGIGLKQTFAKEGKELRRRAGGYAHAKQFRRLKKVVKRQRTILGIVMREVQRKRPRPPGLRISRSTYG